MTLACSSSSISPSPPSSSSSPSPSAIVTYSPSTEETNNIALWSWVKTCGAKRRRCEIEVEGKKTKVECLRQRFWCKLRKTKECLAAYYVERFEDGREEITVESSHNHSPNPPRVQKRVLEEAKQQAAFGATPAVIQKNLIDKATVLEDGSIDPTAVPTKKQIEGIAYRLKQSHLPTRDWFANLTLRFKDYLLQITLYPTIRVILSSPTQLNILKTQRDLILCIDTTFDFIEEKVYITTLFANVNGVGLPLAWFLHSDKTFEEYRHFLRFINKKTRAVPLVFLRDFDLAIQRACYEAFPQTPNFGDYFHFKKDNIQWMIQHQGSHEKKNLSRMLTTLWEAKTEHSFLEALTVFNTHWTLHFPQYHRYFTETWMKLRLPETWASYARRGVDERIPSGDQSLESYHRKLHKEVRDKRHQAIDVVVFHLVDDWERTLKVVRTDKLLEERLGTNEKQRKTREKRTTLTSTLNPRHLQIADVTPPQALPSATTSSSSSSSSIFSRVLTQKGKEDSEEEMEEIFDTPISDIEEEEEEEEEEGQNKQANLSRRAIITRRSASTPSTSDSSLTLSSSSSSNNLVICDCKKQKRNASCVRNLCIDCCAATLSIQCGVRTHRMKKAHNSKWYTHINNAIEKQQTIWIFYEDAGSKRTTRAVTPRGWLHHHYNFEAYCSKRLKMRTFSLDRVLSVSLAPLPE